MMKTAKTTKTEKNGVTRVTEVRKTVWAGLINLYDSKRKLAASMGGVLITALGVGVLMAAGMGTDPFNVLMSGLLAVFPVSYSVLFVILNVTMLTVALFLNRGWIGIVTILTLSFTGMIAQVVSSVLNPIVDTFSIVIVLMVVLFGLLLECFGVALCIKSNMGVSPYDAVYLILSERLPLSIRTCRITLDLSCALIGLLLGGIVGIGTGLAIVCMGPVISFLVRIMERKAESRV